MREKYKRGLTIATDLVEHPRSGEPPLMERKRFVADLYYSLGDIADDPVEARECYTQSLMRRLEWRKSNPELLLPIMSVANCYHDLAKASFHLRDLQAASRYFAECLKLRDEALSRQPQSVLAKLLLAFEHERLGEFQVRTGHPEEGKASLLNAQARYEELLSADPKNEEDKKHLSRAATSWERPTSGCKTNNSLPRPMPMRSRCARRWQRKIRRTCPNRRITW